MVNSEGLPASVFRTDDWDDAEPPMPAAAVRAGRLAEIRELAEKLKTQPAKGEESKALKAKLDELLKAFKAGEAAVDSGPQPGSGK